MDRRPIIGPPRKRATSASLHWFRHCVVFLGASVALLSAEGGCLPAGGQSDAEVEAAAAIANGTESNLVWEMPDRLADLVPRGDIGRLIGLEDDRVPYPDSYWPFDVGGIDVSWRLAQDGSDARSPLEKYVTATNPDQLAAAREWNATHHGPLSSGVEAWEGLCPGWTQAAINQAPLHHAVDAVYGDDHFVACMPWESGCVRYEIGDINALEAEVYLDGPYMLAGDRCTVPAEQIPRDEFGRVVRSAALNCQGFNPGALLVLAAHQLRDLRVAFGINAQSADHTDQVWNQPVYRYRVTRFDPLDETEAANLVAYGTRTGAQTAYRWNEGAHGWVLMTLELSWVTEHGPNVTPVSGLAHSRLSRVVAVVELDRPSSDPDARVVGGEYLEGGEAESATRLDVPSFAWISRGKPGPEDRSLDAGSNSHNPFLKPSRVLELVSLARD